MQDFYENELNKIKNRSGLFQVVDFQHKCKVSAFKINSFGQERVKGGGGIAFPFDSAFQQK